MASKPIISIQNDKSFNNFFPDEMPALLPETISFNKARPLRLLNMNGAYIYAQPPQILLVEASDHLVVVHLSAGDKIKKAIRHVSLGEMEKLLAGELFHRINRYCIINIRRLSGVNLEENELEYDMLHNVRTEHPLLQPSSAVLECKDIHLHGAKHFLHEVKRHAHGVMLYCML